MNEKAIFCFSALLALSADAAEVFVSPSGSHSAPYSSWAAASTNISAGIAALNSGDVLTIAPGTYFVSDLVVSGTNKVVRGGRGTLFDADRTLLIRTSGSASVLAVDGVGCRVAGLTLVGSPPSFYSGGVYLGGTSNVAENCILRGNSVGGISLADSAVFRNCIAAGNSTGLTQQVASTWAGRVERCVVEQNSQAQISVQGWVAMFRARNSAIGFPSYYVFNAGGCATNDTTNSVGSLCGYAGSSWTATGFAWGGVRAYISTNRAGAAFSGPAYFGGASETDGVLGPAALPWLRQDNIMETDFSTNANHGTMAGAFGSSTSSPFGGASAMFARPWSDDARSNGFMRASFVPPAMTGYPLSIEAWLNSSGPSGSRMAVSAWKANDWYTGWWLGLNSANKACIGVGYANGSYKELLSPAPVSGWTHVAGAWSSATSMVLFVNGIAVATNTASVQAPPSLAELDIGRQPILIPGNYFGGLISDVRIWSVARSSAQIADNMNKRLSGTEAGLEAYYRFDGGGAGGPRVSPGPFNVRNPVLDPEGD